MENHGTKILDKITKTKNSAKEWHGPDLPKPI